MNIDALVMAVNVRRWHTANTDSETVGHHTALTALFTSALLDAMYPDNRIQRAQPLLRLYALELALGHDLGEYRTGDIPAPAKWSMTRNELEALNDTEYDAALAVGVCQPLDPAGLDRLQSERARQTAKMADYLAGMLSTAVCAAKGNTFASTVYERYVTWFAAHTSSDHELLCAARKLSAAITAWLHGGQHGRSNQ